MIRAENYLAWRDYSIVSAEQSIKFFRMTNNPKCLLEAAKALARSVEYHAEMEENLARDKNGTPG